MQSIKNLILHMIINRAPAPPSPSLVGSVYGTA